MKDKKDPPFERVRLLAPAGRLIAYKAKGFGAEFGSRTSRQMGVFDGWDSHDPASGTKSRA